MNSTRFVGQRGMVFLLFGVAIATGSDSQTVISVLGLFVYAGLRLQPSVQQVIGSLNEIKHATAPLDDLYVDKILGWHSRRFEQIDPLQFKESLRLEDVSLRYESADRDALSEVNLVVRPGEQIGICGPTRGGKTSLVDIVTGLLRPTAGIVSVDGNDLHHGRDAVRRWQRSLGVVPQMVFLIDDTLRRNIALGIPDNEIDEDALREAVALCQFTEFVNSLPEGLETSVGERSTRLSGGQRQQVAIARAQYRRPSVLILDEGTSAVNSATEASIVDAVDRLRGDRTIIMVAHRLITVKQSDKVVFVEDGRIAGSIRSQHSSVTTSASGFWLRGDEVTYRWFVRTGVVGHTILVLKRRGSPHDDSFRGATVQSVSLWRWDTSALGGVSGR